MKQINRKLLFLSATLFLNGCRVRNTENGTLAYKYWSGSRPPKEIEVLHAEYRESSGWSKKYFVYLDITASTQWIQGFIEKNKWVKAGKAVTPVNKIPGWFNPSFQSEIFVSSEPGNPSAYYYDSLRHKLFIYEEQ